MATANPYIGRREGIGLGLETVPGTSVAPTTWLFWLDQDLVPKTTVVENESAIGSVQRVNSSAIVEKWAEGRIGGKVTDVAIGYLLKGFFGSVSTGAASGGIYPHTFSTNQSSVPATLTISNVTPLQNKRHSYGTVDSLEFNAEAGGYVTVEAGVKARVGATASDTPSYTDQIEFTSKHVTLKVAANTGALSGATALSVRSVKLQLERPSENYNALGTDDTPSFDRGAEDVRGEFVVRMTDTQYETDFLANTAQAMEIKLTNGTTILTFTMPQVRYREIAKNVDKANIVTLTVQFAAEFDTSTSTAITPVLNNATATY